VINTLPTNE